MRALTSRVVYANPWMTVREDVVERADGARAVWGVVDKPDFAVVIAESPEGVHLVEQFRYPTGRRSWELPMGTWSAGTPESVTAGGPLALAQAELAEETGMRADRWERLGELFAAGGFCSQRGHVFVATGLTPGAHAREDSEADMVHEVVPVARMREMMQDGRIVDSITMAAFAMWSVR
ncbi:NUDIX hydrolase [Nakamurella sp. YIM 132084]|uniref:NUDIX hydrolase n=1 Tax=Nakamurella leprariae TaxID=2803911 RepID=A0A938YK01_9ACTN|nr:NUDIX hydrolase [Nakamurella leprariae]